MDADVLIGSQCFYCSSDGKKKILSETDSKLYRSSIQLSL